MEIGRSALAKRASRHNHASNTLKFPGWAASALAIEAGSQTVNEAQFPQPAQPVSSFPNVEIMSTSASFPFPSAQSGLTESVLVPLVNQFGLMQQQMFDQFQQAMAMMVQMFGTMHRDQMEVIRAELDRLHELTEEFHALKDELANRTREQTRTVLNQPTERGQTAVTATISAAPSQQPAARKQEPVNGLGTAQVVPEPVLPPRKASRVPVDQPVQKPRPSPTQTPPLSSPIAAPHSFEPPGEPGLPPQPTRTSPDPPEIRNAIPWSGSISGSCRCRPNAKAAGKRSSSSCPESPSTMDVVDTTGQALPSDSLGLYRVRFGDQVMASLCRGDSTVRLKPSSKSTIG